MQFDKNMVDLETGRKLVQKKKRNSTTEIADFVWRAHCLPVPDREYKIYPHEIREGRTKKVPWRADFAYPEYKLAIEIEGGVYSRGRHVRAAGYRDDCEKYNFITGELGWTILRYTPQKIDYRQIQRVLHNLAKGRAYERRY